MIKYIREGQSKCCTDAMGLTVWTLELLLMSDLLFTIRSLHNVHEINTHRAGNVCLSVRMIQLENRWTDLDENWYGRYAIGRYPLTPNFLQSTIQTWRTNELVR
jgi:hypothetical protein